MYQEHGKSGQAGRVVNIGCAHTCICLQLGNAHSCVCASEDMFLELRRVGSDNHGHGSVCVHLYMLSAYVCGLTHGYTMHVCVTSGVSYSHIQITQSLL